MKQYCNVARYKNQIFVRELVEGVEQRRKVKFRPSLFQSTTEKTDWQNFYGDGYVERRTFDSPFEMKNFVEEFKSIPNEVWGNTDIVSQFIYEGGYDTTDAQNIKVSYLDIEVCTREKINGQWIDGGFPDAQNASFPINAICDYRPYKKKYYVFTTAKGWTPKKSQLKYADEVEYIYCPSEDVLIEKWMRFWESDYPHINSGWNNKSFDIPYIINRLKRLKGEEFANRISPWRVLTEKKSVGKFGQDIISYEILGIGIVDYLDLYQKYRYVPREKYTLDYISRCELPDEHKLEFKGTHGSLYYDDPVFFVDYNIQDVRCVVKFEEKLQFMNLIIFLSYYSGINFEENFSPIKIWETLIYRTAADKGIVIPMKPENVAKEPDEGAYVHDPVPGLKGAIASFDFTSLYPSLMRLYYIAPDVHQTGQKKAKLYTGLMDTLRSDKSNEATEMFKEIMETGIFNSYYVNHDLPESVTKFLQGNKVSLATNCEFYNIERESIFIRLIADLFAGRKSDKKQSFNYKHKAQDIEQELEKRGTFPEYANLSVEELETQHKEAKHLANVYDVSQLVKKILLD